VNKSKDETICSFLRGDLNCDNHVNLIDFSIMAYWYKKINPPEKVDLNNDGKITLVDFSIMAFNWTG
ncbi:MAG: dockerin type I domain-containing protein, partial [Candidatus Paceibacterota bacterium]